MSRFGIPHPFYDKMERDLEDERMRRILAIRVEYRNCATVYQMAIVDRDPGDEHVDLASAQDGGKGESDAG